MNNRNAGASYFIQCLLGMVLIVSVVLPGTAQTVGGGSAAISSIPVPPEAHRVAEFLRRMGRTETADRFEQDIGAGRVKFGALDPGTNGQTGRWVANAGANGTEYSNGMLNQLRPTTPDSSPVLIGWAITVEHEYVHMGQRSPDQVPAFENPAWSHSLDVGQSWMRKTMLEMGELERTPDSPEKSARLKELTDLMAGLREAHNDTISGIREGIAGKTIDPSGPWPTIDNRGASDIGDVMTSADKYGKQWTQDGRDAQADTARRLKQTQQDALIEKQRLADQQKQKQEQEQRDKEQQAKDAADAAAATAAAEQGKEKALAELRIAIPKTRSALAQLKALKEHEYAAQVETLLAQLLAQYRALAGVDFQADKAGKKPPPGKKADEVPADGGTVTHADGSRTVLTYRVDSSGNRVPVTTEYDRNGQVTSKSSVDSKGRSIPVK